MDDPKQTASAQPAYSYKPSLLGAPWLLQLTPDALAWTMGRHSGRLPYRDIARMRMSFRPITMQAKRYLTEIWAPGTPKITIASASWKSMMEQERLDGAYAVFVRELHRRISRANGATQFERGSNRLIYWLGVLVFAGAAVGLAALIVRALQAGAMASAAIVGAFFVFYLWQAGNFFRRNRPGTYRPDALPADVMPRE